jgi:hypothetical protein
VKVAVGVLDDVGEGVKVNVGVLEGVTVKVNVGVNVNVLEGVIVGVEVLDGVGVNVIIAHSGAESDKPDGSLVFTFSSYSLTYLICVNCFSEVLKAGKMLYEFPSVEQLPAK